MENRRKIINEMFLDIDIYSRRVLDNCLYSFVVRFL